MHTVKCALCGSELRRVVLKSVTAIGCSNPACLLSVKAVEEIQALYAEGRADSMKKLRHILGRGAQRGEED